MDPTCFNCGNPSEEGVFCERCFCKECGFTRGLCMCYAEPTFTSDYDPNFSNYPQNDFNFHPQNSYEQELYFNDNSFQNSSNFENCGGSFENFYYDPNSCYDSHGFNQPPQTHDMVQVPNEVIDEMKSLIEMVREFMANRITYTPDPHEKSMEELLAEEREAKLRKTFIHDDSNDEEINFFPQRAPVVSSVESEDSLKMGDEHLNTIPATESDEFNKSSVENLVPIPSESGEISNGDCEFIEDKPSDPLEPELQDSLPDFEKYVFDTAEECELSPIENSNDCVEMFSDSDNDDSISCGDIEYVNEVPSELVSLEEENDEEVDTEIQDEALRETLLNVNLLISRIEALNNPPTFSPIPVMDSDFLPELEIFRFEETSSGNPTIHADISLPDYECFNFEIDSMLISDNPLRNPLLEDVDLFLATEDSIPPGIENDENNILSDLLSSRPPAKPPDIVFESGTNEVILGVVDEISELNVPVLDILPTQPTRDSELDFAIVIRVFQPFFSYPLISSLFHSTGSEDTVFDPGISVFYAGCPFHLLSPRTN
jgi:hypothetical protein